MSERSGSNGSPSKRSRIRGQVRLEGEGPPEPHSRTLFEHEVRKFGFAQAKTRSTSCMCIVPANLIASPGTRG